MSLSIRTRLTLWYAGLLLAVLVMAGVVSHSLLRRSLTQDLDVSLLTVGHVLGETAESMATGALGPSPETLLRERLGSELDEKLFQLIDPRGVPGFRSSNPDTRVLPLSPTARVNAAHGLHTFETIHLPRDGPVRLLTLPVLADGRLLQIVQVAIPLRRSQQTLDRFAETLLVLIPVAVALAAAGGALIARAGLAPVHAMAETAHRIGAEDLSQRVPVRGTGDELDDLAGTLNATFARLENAFTELRRFAADAAHELRTPLTVLRGEIEVALRTERAPEEYRRVLRSSLEETERLIRLAEDLLLLSRSAAGPETPRAAVDLEPLVLELAEVGARLGSGAGVSVCVTDLTPATVAGDVLALRRAVLNLVENAVKYTPAGGKVELSLVRQDDHARITVQDTGPGIDPADFGRVFEPFVRLDAARARDTGGAGLGLAIARSIVIAHGGQIGLESRPGHGTRFIIELPVARTA